jgi:hypothetical protein
LIYGYAFTVGTYRVMPDEIDGKNVGYRVSHTDAVAWDEKLPGSGLSQTCRQIHEETKLFPITLNTFYFDSPDMFDIAREHFEFEQREALTKIYIRVSYSDCEFPVHGFLDRLARKHLTLGSLLPGLKHLTLLFCPRAFMSTAPMVEFGKEKMTMWAVVTSDVPIKVMVGECPRLAFTIQEFLQSKSYSVLESMEL